MIDKRKSYGLSMLVEESGMSYYKLKNEIIYDLAKPDRERVLKPIIVGKGRNTRYIILGANFLKFLESQKI